MSDRPEPGPESDPADGPQPERMRILELLAQRRISAAEAAELLSALASPPAGDRKRTATSWRPPQPPPAPPRWFRVRVTDARSGRTRANVAVPLGMVGFGATWGGRWGVHRHGDDILSAVRAGQRGVIFDVCDPDGGHRVELLIE